MYKTVYSPMERFRRTVFFLCWYDADFKKGGVLKGRAKVIKWLEGTRLLGEMTGEDLGFHGAWRTAIWLSQVEREAESDNECVDLEETNIRLSIFT